MQLDASAIELVDKNLNREMLVERFDSLERWFAFLLLRYSGKDGSLKLVLRNYEREPYLLVRKIVYNCANIFYLFSFGLLSRFSFLPAVA